MKSDPRSPHPIALGSGTGLWAPHLLVGEAPNEATSDQPHLWLRPDGSGIPHAANRLLEHLGPGWDLERYMRTFDRTNVLTSWPGRSPNGGAAFPLAEARRGAERLVRDRLVRDGEGCPWVVVVVLGKRAAMAFRWGEVVYDHSGIGTGGRGRAPKSTAWVPDFLQTAVIWCSSFPLAVVCPHPSGLNRWWNDPANVERFRELTRDW